MTTILTHSFWLNALIVVGLIGAAEEVIRRLVGKPIARVWKKVERFLDTWNGEPARDGLPARPGLVDRVITMEGRVIAIEYQVHNNGGGSMKDTVDGLARTVGRIETATELAATKATTAATKAEESALVATETKAALDAHVEQSAQLMADGDKREKRIWDALDSRRALDGLAEALPIVARSTPHEEEQP